MATLTIEWHDGTDFVEATVYAKRKLCDLCDGDGKYVNPSIDAGGLNPADFADDPEFMEAYRAGDYDVPCRKCDGSGKVLVPDLDDDHPYWAWQRELAEQERQARYTRMMEDGEYDEGWADARWG